MLQLIVKIFTTVTVITFITVIGFTLSQPETYRVVRTVEISADISTVFNKVSDLRNWPTWSPWFKRDSKMIIKFSDDTASIGGYSTWDSETEGSGKQTITEINQNQSLKIDLEFYKPFEGTASSDFTFVNTSPNKTKVSWGLDGKNEGFIGKLFYGLLDYDSMIGKDYEAGLQSLKKISESN